MTKWPTESKMDWKAADGPFIELADTLCFNPNCLSLTSDRHHIFSRGQLGMPSEWVCHIPTNKWYQNVIGLCRPCHTRITENKDWIQWREGNYYWNGEERINLGGRIERQTTRSKPMEPGKVCPTCERRIPHPKKLSSPATKVVTYRIPQDDVETHREILGQAAKVLGTKEKPHWTWATITMMSVIVLQMNKKELDDIFQRGG